MAQATPRSHEALAASPIAPQFGHFAKKLGRELDLQDFRTGSWFAKLITLYLRHYEAHAMREAARARGAEAKTTEAIIQRACVEAALAGTATATVSTGATVYASDTAGAGLVVAVPVSLLAIGGEALVRSLIHLRMTCDLASAFDVQLHPDDPSDISRLYALVFGTERHGDTSEDSGLGMLKRMLSSGAEDLGEKLGTKVLGESLARNILPFASVLTSPLASWKRTRHLGGTMLEYVRFRRALGDCLTALMREYSDEGGLLAESAWFLFIADGALAEEEAAILAHMLRRLPRDKRRQVLARLEEDEEAWLRRLHQVPESARDLFLQTLVVLSAADAAAPPAEWNALEKAARALGRSLNRGQHDSLLRRFDEDGVVPWQPLTFLMAQKRRARRAPAKAKAKAKTQAEAPASTLQH
ncbi:MAG: hypothetical protein ACXU86_20100 [Archangium sp.]